ncbi:MAG TPA: hypothetical protein VJ184_01570 [Chryseolinea sp.]|nr:hypothetical protein [Chryseolinea sp.]
MNARITVPKIALESKDFLNPQIKSLCNDVEEVEDGYVYFPKTGKLFDLLNLFRDYKIAYDTQFSTQET